MKNLEDCKAEVFRRSEERIKERKRARKRVLVCCISLCLLLVAGGLYLRPLFEPVDDMGKSEGMSRDPDRVAGGTDVMLHSNVTKYPSVAVTKGIGDTAVSKIVTDADGVGELCGVMAMYFGMSADYSIGGLDGADGVIDTSIGTTGKESVSSETDRNTIEDELKSKYGLEEKTADYTIVFRESTGEETVLRLYENNLYNESNGCVVTLSDGQLAELKSKLAQVVTNED